MIIGSSAKIILVVEDNKMIRYQVSRFLLNHGYDVRQAATGLEALAKATGADLILMDIRMPDMDGLEATRRLKDNPRTAAIPIIFLTGLNEEEVMRQGLALGAVGYVTKPANLVLLIDEIRKHIEEPRG